MSVVVKKLESKTEFYVPGFSRFRWLAIEGEPKDWKYWLFAYKPVWIKHCKVWWFSEKISIINLDDKIIHATNKIQSDTGARKGLLCKYIGNGDYRACELHK